MHMVYLDESGELGFSSGSSNFFIITMVTTPEAKKLKNVMRKEKKKLHDLGWPKEIEIKGTSLFRSHLKEKIPGCISDNRVQHIQKIIGRIKGCGTKFHYCCVDKNKLTDAMKSAPYGVLYNIFSARLLGEIYRSHTKCEMAMIVDQRSKETHDWAKFDGYVTTTMFADFAYDGELTITHAESDKIIGLQAVDFISWGLFRFYEHKDETFADLIKTNSEISIYF